MKLVPFATVKAHTGKLGCVEDSGEVIAPGSGKELYVGRFRKVGS